MITKQDKAEAIESVRDALKACSPEGAATVEIRWVGGGATPTGRSDYYEIRIWHVDNGRPRPHEWLNRNFCRATGYRFNPKREAVLLTGCGYSKSQEIAEHLASIAQHPIHVTCPGESFGPDSIVKPRRAHYEVPVKDSLDSPGQ